MRKSLLFVAIAAALPIIASTAAKPAMAETVYPFCTTGSRWEGPRCDYRTFEQCVAVNAGFNTMCVPNRWYSEAQSPGRRRDG